MDGQRFTATVAALLAAVLMLIYAKSILMPFVIAIMSA